MTAHKGERHHKAKLTEDDVRDIRRRYDGGEKLESIWHSYPQIENCWGTLHPIVKRKTWKHIDVPRETTTPEGGTQ